MPIDLTSIKCDTCLECGYQNAEGARYCPKCNYSLPMPLTTKEFQNWTAPGADPLASVHAAVGIASEKINPGDLLTALRCDPHIENLLKTRDEAGIMEPRMGSEASAIIHRDTALAKAKDDASKITGVALTGWLAEDLVEGLYEEYQLPRIPSLPSLPIPSLPNFPSLPTFDLLTSVVSAKDNFEASGEEKARLKVKMSKAMGAMSKLKKEGL